MECWLWPSEHELSRTPSERPGVYLSRRLDALTTICAQSSGLLPTGNYVFTAPPPVLPLRPHRTLAIALRRYRLLVQLSLAKVVAAASTPTQEFRHGRFEDANAWEQQVDLWVTQCAKASVPSNCPPRTLYLHCSPVLPAAVCSRGGGPDPLDCFITLTLRTIRLSWIAVSFLQVIEAGKVYDAGKSSMA